MLSRATWRESEKSSTLRSKSVLSLMQNWAAASLMVSCGEDHQSISILIPLNVLPKPSTFLHHQMRSSKPLEAYLDAELCEGWS